MSQILHNALLRAFYRTVLFFAVATNVTLAESPYDAYYKQQANGRASTPPAGTAPIDNDQYYTAPGQYIENKNYPTVPAQSAPQPIQNSHGCNSISDSPECLGD